MKQTVSCVNSLSWNLKAQLFGWIADQLNSEQTLLLCIEKPRLVQIRSSAKIKMWRPNASGPHNWPSGIQSIKIMEIWSIEDSRPAVYTWRNWGNSYPSFKTLIKRHLLWRDFLHLSRLLSTLAPTAEG